MLTLYADGVVDSRGKFYHFRQTSATVPGKAGICYFVKSACVTVSSTQTFTMNIALPWANKTNNVLVVSGALTGAGVAIDVTLGYLCAEGTAIGISGGGASFVMYAEVDACCVGLEP